MVPNLSHHRWATEVFDAASRVLLPEQTRESLCEAPVWLSGPAHESSTEEIVVIDGAYEVPGRPRVPAYLLIPQPTEGAEFNSRGAVIVLHGHDSGRREVIGRPTGYQKAMALRLAEEGFVVLAPDIVSWGDHDPLGDGKGKHSKDWLKYAETGPAGEGGNGFITWAITDLVHAVTLLQGLHVGESDSGDWRPASPHTDGARAAVRAVGISGLSFGAELASYMLLDSRPSAYLIASGLIDSCDVVIGDHHKCQRVPAFEGRLALWDLISAGALLPRASTAAPPCIQVQQGLADKIFRAWGEHGVTTLRERAARWPLFGLSIREDSSAGHTYLVDEALSFFRGALSPAPRCATLDSQDPHNSN